MSSNIDNLDEETKNILKQALSAQAQLHSMGMTDKQNATRAKEQAEFAAEMERKNELARQRRANAIIGIPPEEALAQQAKSIVASQKPPTKKKKTGMVRQTTEKIYPVSGMPKEGDFPVETQESSVEQQPQPQTPVAPVEIVPPQPGQLTAVEPAPVFTGPTVEQSLVLKQVQEHALHNMIHQVTTPAPFDTHAENHDFNAFTEITNWPSRGLLYDNPVYGQSFKTGDLIMLGDIGDDNSSRVMSTILSRRVKGINSDDILTCDETYLLHWLRASSYTEEGLPHPGYVCDKCKFDIRQADIFKEFKINFGNLRFHTNADPAEVIARHKEKGYVSTVLYDGRECDVYLRRRKHDIIIEEETEKWERAHRYAGMPKHLTKLMKIAVVVEIEGCETLEDKMNYIDDFPIAKKSELFDLITDNSLVTSITAEIKCARCGGTVETPYPFLLKPFISSL